MTFRVGQRVVCVDDTIARGYGDENYPKRGDIYTIRAIMPFLSECGEAMFLLHEVTNSVRDYRTDDYSLVRTEKPFGARRFRPLIERKTDISIFTAMLTPQGVDA